MSMNKKVPYFVKMAVFEFPFQSKNKQTKPLFPIFGAFYKDLIPQGAKTKKNLLTLTLLPKWPI